MDLAIGTTIVRTMLSNPILGTIGIQMTLQCLQTLSSTTQEIYGFITTIKTTTHHVNIGSTLMELDLASEIVFIESLLREISLAIENDEKKHTQSLAVSVKLLKDCLLDIHSLLDEINKRIEYNTKLWVTGYGFRTYRFDDVDGKLHFLANNLEKRKRNMALAIQVDPFIDPAPMISEDINEQDDEELIDVSVVSIDKIVTYEKSVKKYQ
jgi:hypothetical protein